MKETNNSMKITEYWGSNDQEEYPPHLLGVIGIFPIFILIIRKMFIKLGMVFMVFDKLAVLIVSLVFALVIHHNKYDDNLTFTDFMHPRVLLTIILPLKILRVTYNLDIYLIRRCFLNIILVSMLGAPLIGIIHGFTILIFDKSVNLKHVPLYAILVSPTDEIDWSILFKEYEIMKLPLTILDGEFLITTSASLIGLDVYTNYLIINRITNWYEVLGEISRLLFGGILVGLFVGKMCKFLIPPLLFRMKLTICTILMITLFTFMSCEQYLYVSGSVAVLIIALYINNLKSLMNSSFQTNMLIAIESVNYALTAISHFLVFTQTFLILIKGLHFSVTEIIISSWISLIFRILMLLIMGPFMKRLNKTLDFKSFLCLIWMSMKGIVQLLEAETVYYDTKLHCEISIVGQLFCSIVFDLVLRAVFTNQFMASVGLTDVSQFKRENFTNCIKIIEDKKEVFIDTMRNNRTFAEVKWNFIKTSTDLSQHLIQLDKDFLPKGRKAYCGDCKKDVNIKPFRRELYQLLCDTKLKVLKAKKKYLLHLYERGMVDVEHVRFLMHDIETAESTHLKFSVSHLIKLFERKNFIDKLRNFLSDIIREEIVIKKPRKKFRIMCYKVVMYKWYEVILYLIVIGAAVDHYIGFFFDTFVYFRKIPFILVYISDFVLKINAYSRIYISDGFHTYFRNDWNKMEFVLLLINIISLCLFPIYHWFPHYFYDSHVAYRILRQLQELSNLRLLKLILLFYNVKPYILKICNNIIENRISFAFTAGQAMLFCYEEVIHNLPTLVSYVDIYDQIFTSLDEDRKELDEVLRSAHLDLPLVISNCKAKFVSRAILYSTNETIKRLIAKGLLNKKEYEMLREMMASKFRRSSAQISSGPIAPHLIFTEQPWLDGYDKINSLEEHLKVLTFKPEETLIKTGDLAEGIFIIMEGRVGATYEPDAITLERLAISGILPVIDEINFKNFATANNQIFFAGQSLGILSVLTNRPSNITITTKTKTKAFFLERNFLYQYIHVEENKKFNGLYSRLWKFVARELATAILWEVPPYINMPKEQLFQYMDDSFIPNLANTSVFEVSEGIEDMVLVEGIVIDEFSNSLFRGPCRVPRTARSLCLVSSQYTPILLIVPRENTDPSFILENIYPGLILTDRFDICYSTKSTPSCAVSDL